MTELLNVSRELPTPGQVFADQTFDAVLFDMDGTLVNSIPATEYCWGTWMTTYGYEPHMYNQFHGTPARAIIDMLLPEEQRDAAFEFILDLEMNAKDGIVPLPGSRAAFAAIPLEVRSVVTSATRELAKLRLELTGLETKYLVSVDDVAHGKPHPAPFLAGAALLGVDPARCLVIEDAPAGLASGKAAGAATIALPGSSPLHELDADAYLTSLEAIEFVWDESSKTISVRDK